MSGKGLRTVLIGFGQIAAGLQTDAHMARYFSYATHAQVLAGHPDFQWLGVADPNAEACQAAADTWFVPHVDADALSLARLVDAEVAIITAPPAARPAVLDAFPNLKAVLVEKPLTLDETDGTGFVTLCRERGIHLQVNFWRRADLFYSDLAGGRLAALLGKPQAVFATYGNGLRNNGTHLVDFARLLLGEVMTVRALGPATPAAGTPLAGDVHIPLALTLDGGILATVLPLDFDHYREVGLDIWGTKGRLALYQEGLGVFHYPLADNRGLENGCEIANDRPQVLEPTVGQALYRMYDNLAAAVRDGTPLFSPGESAQRTEAVIAAALRSSTSGGTLEKP